MAPILEYLSRQYLAYLDSFYLVQDKDGDLFVR